MEQVKTVNFFAAALLIAIIVFSGCLGIFGGVSGEGSSGRGIRPLCLTSGPHGT